MCVPLLTGGVLVPHTDQKKKTRSYSLLLFRSWSKDSLHSSASCEESLEKTKGHKSHFAAHDISPGPQLKMWALQPSSPVTGNTARGWGTRAR